MEVHVDELDLEPLLGAEDSYVPIAKQHVEANIPIASRITPSGFP